jgi:hypothetical protein
VARYELDAFAVEAVPLHQQRVIRSLRSVPEERKGDLHFLAVLVPIGRLQPGGNIFVRPCDVARGIL